MAKVETFVKDVKAHCREHGILKGGNRINSTFFCGVCGVTTSLSEVLKNCYAPHFYQQRNPFIEFK